MLASLHLDGIVLRMEVSHLDGISYSLSCSDGLFCRMEFSQWMGPQSGWFFLGWVFKSGWFSPQDGLLAVDGFFLGWSSRSGWFFLGWTSRSGWFFLGWTFRSGWFSPQDGLLAVDGFLAVDGVLAVDGFLRSGWFSPQDGLLAVDGFF